METISEKQKAVNGSIRSRLPPTFEFPAFQESGSEQTRASVKKHRQYQKYP
jgi:hypothetical protein